MMNVEEASPTPNTAEGEPCITNTDAVQSGSNRLETNFPWENILALARAPS